ncbi:hypothetical protein ES703_122721 [subsurface metagenome]
MLVTGKTVGAEGGKAEVSVSPAEMFVIAAAVVKADFISQEYRVCGGVGGSPIVLALLGAVGDQGRAGVDAAPGDRIRTPGKFCVRAVGLGIVDGGQAYIDAGVVEHGHSVRLQMVLDAFQHDLCLGPLQEVLARCPRDLASARFCPCPRDADVLAERRGPEGIIVRIACDICFGASYGFAPMDAVGREAYGYYFAFEEGFVAALRVGLARILEDT